MKKNKYLCTRFTNIYPYYNKKFINFMEKIFTLLRGKQLMFFIMTALLMGAVETAKADYSITGEGILNSSEWKKTQETWWKAYSSGMYDYAAERTSSSELISPKISKTKGGINVTIMAYGGYMNNVLKYYYSTDEKATWTEFADLSEDLNNYGYGSGQTKAFTGTFSTESKEFYVKVECMNIFISSFKVEEFSLPEMTVYKDAYNTKASDGETIDFGLVTAAPSYTYYVKNTKRGTLYVEAEANGGYSVSPTKFALEAGQQQEVTVTAPAKGESEGTLTITGMDGEEVLSTFTANFKGEVMDKEGKFFEDFNGTSLTPVQASDLPGWDVDVTEHEGAEGYYGRTQFYTDNGKTVLFYYANSDEDYAAYLITPKLHVKGENDIMYFNGAGITGANVKVSYSSDKSAWKTIGTFYNSGYTTHSFKNIPEGDYYIKFELWNATIDWVYGFVLSPESDALVLDETVVPEALTAGVQDVDLKYTVKEGWNTISLPFAVDDLSVFGEGAKAYELTGYNDGALNFKAAETLKAGSPYVLYVETAAEAKGNFMFEGVDITATEPATVGFNDAKFVATYAPMAAGTMTGKYGVVPSTGKIQKGGANATMKGFRAYFELPAGTNGARMIIDGEDVTAISSIITDAENGNAIYNLNGQRVNAATKGVYIINGKKMIIK